MWTIEEWDTSICLELAAELSAQEFYLVQKWKAAGEPSFDSIELYSRRRVFYAMSPTISADHIRLLVRLRNDEN